MALERMDEGCYRCWVPLSEHAARKSSGAFVILVVDKDAVDAQPGDGAAWKTPLCFAAEEGHEAIARLLLDEGANGVDPEGRV